MMRIGIASTMGENAPSYHLRFRSVLAALERSGQVKCHTAVRKGLLGMLRRIAPAAEANVLLVARIRDLDHLKNIYNVAERKNIPLVYDTDDLFLYERRSDAPAACAKEISAYLSKASCIITSTAYLADELRSLNSRVSVFPNLIDPAIWDISKPAGRSGGRPLRICCIGTGLMSENISLIVPAMEFCSDRYGRDVVFCLWGNAKYLDERVKKLKNVTISDKKMPYRAFARKLQHEAFDLGVVPLSDLRFNRAKSNIKYLEYAASGIPSIFSRVEAYAGLHQGDTCLLADNDPDAWIPEIVRMVEDRGLRKRLAERAYDDVSSRFVLNGAWAQNYLSILENVLGRTDGA